MSDTMMLCPTTDELAEKAFCDAEERFGYDKAELLGFYGAYDLVAARHWVWRQMVEDGLTVTDIARLFGRNYSTVYMALARCQRPVRGKLDGAAQLQRALARAEADFGLSRSEILHPGKDAVRVSARMQVWRELKRAGLIDREIGELTGHDRSYINLSLMRPMPLVALLMRLRRIAKNGPETDSDKHFARAYPPGDYLARFGFVLEREDR